jgi:ABC-2 type transport system ATP-binding protein
MNVIECRNVSKRFDGVVAVDNLSFEVGEGSIFGLLGPNGAGKTTMIRMIVDIFAPDSGEISVFGGRLTRETRRLISYLPEERGLYKKMKIGEQLLFFARIRGVDADEAKRRIETWLQRLDLWKWKDKKADELSKGMQQKAQFVATVLSDPSLLILDEPFSGLDPISAGMLKSVIMDLKQLGKTIIFSSHQMEQVEQMCDSICLISHATKILGGSLREIKRQFGRDTILLDFDGPDAFLTSQKFGRVTRRNGHVEILLKNGATSQDVLQSALAAGVFVRRFESVEPSLNDIFIESVTKSNGKNNTNRSA